MRRVLKYEIEIENAGVARQRPQDLQLLRGAEILHVGEQFGMVMLWVLCPVLTGPVHKLPPEEAALSYERRSFQVYGTGYPIDDDCMQYIGTAVIGGGLVWHVFERVEPVRCRALLGCMVEGRKRAVVTVGDYYPEGWLPGQLGHVRAGTYGVEVAPHIDIDSITAEVIALNEPVIEVVRWFPGGERDSAVVPWLRGEGA